MTVYIKSGTHGLPFTIKFCSAKTVFGKHNTEDKIAIDKIILVNLFIVHYLIFSIYSVS